jgi:hypothetical protein
MPYAPDAIYQRGSNRPLAGKTIYPKSFDRISSLITAPKYPSEA